MPHFFPIPGAHLDCVVTCFTGTRVLLVGQFSAMARLNERFFRNFRLNIVSLDFSPGGTYYTYIDL